MKFFLNKNILKIFIKILYTIFFIFIFRLGSFIDIPNIDINDLYYKNLNLYFNKFSKNISIFSLGIMPYIISTSIFNLFIFLYKKNIDNIDDKYILLLTLLISILQSIIYLIYIDKKLFIFNNFNFYIISVISLVLGSMILTWLNKKIDIYGILNGNSIIIFVEIISNIKLNLNKSFIFIKKHIFRYLFFLIFIYIISYIIVFIEFCQKKLIICYPKKYFSNIYLLPDIYIPIKINTFGIVPSTFIYNFFIFFLKLIKIFFLKYNFLFIKKYIDIFTIKKKIIIKLIYNIFIFLFTYIYSYLSFNSKEISNNLIKIDGFIEKIRPGYNTEIYINNILKIIIFLGSLYINMINILSNLVINKLLRLPFYFDSILLILILNISVEIINYIKLLLISFKYDKLINKIYYNKKNKYES